MRLRGDQSLAHCIFSPTVNSHFKPTEAYQCRVHVNPNHDEAGSTDGIHKHVNLEIRGACIVLQSNELRDL